MSRKEFLIELDGIIGTIQTYTRNPFMMGYTKELKKAIKDNDMETLKIILDKMIGWYSEEINKIHADKYVFNKHMHQKAFDILKSYRISLMR